MKMRGKNLTRFDAKARLLGFVLLTLVAHGLVVNVAHHYFAKSYKAESSASTLEANQDDRSGQAPNSNDHSQCPSCQLQRAFTTGLRSPSLTIELLAEHLSYEISYTQSRSRGPVLLRSDRAPPLT